MTTTHLRHLPRLAATFGRWAMVAPLALSAAACTTVRSTPLPTRSAHAAQGLTYFLPTRLMKVTATRAPVNLANLEKALAAKSGAADKAHEAADLAEVAAKQAQQLRDRLDPSAPARAVEQADERVYSAKADFNAKKAAADELDGQVEALQSTLDAVQIRRSLCTYEAKIELLPAQPDPLARYVARIVHNPTRDDATTLKVGPSGLLTSGNVVAADRTADIIVEAAGAISGLGGGAPVSTNAFLPSERADCATLPKTFVSVFDPADPAADKEVTAKLLAAQFPFKVQVAGPPADRVKDEESRGQGYGAMAQGAIYYRSAAPRTVSLLQATTDSCDSAAEDCWQPIDAAVVLVPQAGPVSFIPMNSSAFVKTVNDVQFVDGSIASWTAERPSELLEVVRLPVKIATAIISVPAQLLSLRVNYSTQDKALVEAQKAQIQSAETLRRLKLCLDTAVDDAAAQSCLK